MTLALLLLGCPDPTDTGDTAPSVTACDESVVGNICTWAGTPQAGFNGDGIERREAWLYFPIDVEFSEFGKPLVHDWNNHRLRVLEDDETFTTVMGTAFVGDGPSDLSDRTAPGADGTTVNLNHPTDGIYLPNGLFVDASWHTHKIRILDPATGLVYVGCGDTPGFAGDGDESATTARFNQPKAVEYDESDGTLFILDMRNERVRALASDYTISTIAGNGTKGFAGDGGPAVDANFAFPNDTNPRPGGSLALDAGILYIADSENHRIRAVDLETGLISTVVGTGTAGDGGDGGPATEALLNFPMDIEVADGSLYIADTDNQKIRRVDLVTGIIETVVGNGEIGDDGDDGPATDAQLYTPMGVEIDLDGNLYIADSFNHRIRRVAQ